jgi:glucosamine--fructose-6-phosphate aminotransferase (isomerizing)
LGRGFQYAITKEIALKLQETTYIKALPFATSDFYHGPLAMADDKSNVLVLAPVDETWVNSIEIIERLSQQNCNLYIITDKEDGLDNHENQIVIPKFSLHSFPFTCIVTAQLLALNISLNKGLNPDIPRSLNKVTVTL